MNTRQLKEMMDADAKIDISNLASESIKTPDLHGKYYGLLITEARRLHSLEQDKSSLYKRLFEYYTGKAEDQAYKDRPIDIKVLKSDLHVYVDSDTEWQKLQKEILIQQQRVDMIQDYIKSVINARGFQIKDAIAFLQWQAGK